MSEPGQPLPPPVSGYWPDQLRPIMSNADFMVWNIDDFRLDQIWISATEFGQLFRKLQVDPVDPQVLVVSGVLLKSGEIRLSPTFYLQNGNASPIDSGLAGRITARNSDGTIVAEASFDTSFAMETNTGKIVQSNAYPFLVQVPLSTGPAELEISNGNASLFTFDPNSRLLIDLLNSIPDTAFRKHSSQSRSQLLSRAQEIQQAAKICGRKKHFSGEAHERESCAIHEVRLILELRTAVDRVLKDVYEVVDPLQATRSEVFASIDRAALNTILNPSARSGPKGVSIRLLPESGRYSIFRIVATTQGANGSVSVDPDGGGVSYVPNRRFPVEDAFSVTIADPEGDTVEKTVRILPPIGARSHDDCRIH